MQTKNRHCSEHITLPAHKMITKGRVSNKGKCFALTQAQRKLLKKVHTKRSRRYLKSETREMLED